MMASSGNRAGTAAAWPLAAGVALVFLASLRPISNPGIWTRLASGRAIAESGISSGAPAAIAAGGRSIRSPSWLYDLAAYRLYRAGGAAALLLAHAALFSLGFGCLAAAAGKWVSPIPAGAAMLLAVWLSHLYLAPGPAAVSVAWIGIYFLFFSARRKPAAMAGLLPLQVLWANMSPGFAAGPLIAAMAAVGFWIDSRQAGSELTRDERRHAAHLGLLAAGLALVSFLTPSPAIRATFLHLGREPALRMFPFGASAGSWWFPPSPVRHMTIVVLAVGATGLVARKDRLPILPTAAAVLGAFLVIRSPHLLLWLAILSFPFLAMSLQAIGEEALRLTRPAARQAWSRVSAAGLALLFAATALIHVSGRCPQTAGLPRRFGLGQADELFVADAARTLAHAGALPERFAHLPYDGGPLAWQLPNRPIFIDHRPGLFPRESYLFLTKLLSGDAGEASQLLRDWRMDGVLMNCTWPGAAHAVRELLSGDEWSLDYFDGVAALLVPARRGPGAAASEARLAGSRKLEADADAVAAAVAAGRRPGYRPRLAGAAALYEALGRDRDAARLYELLLESCPQMTIARLQYGILLVRLRDAEPAERHLRQVLRRDRRNADAWYWLSQALALQGRESDAAAAARRALRHAKPGHE